MSSLKFCLIAEGSADVYLRDVPTTQSCSVELLSAIEDMNRNGILHVKADNITIRLKDGSATLPLEIEPTSN